MFTVLNHFGHTDPNNAQRLLQLVFLALFYLHIVSFRFFLFCFVVALRPGPQFFSHVGMEPPFLGS